MKLDKTLTHPGENICEELPMVFLTYLLDGYLPHVYLVYSIQLGKLTAEESDQSLGIRQHLAHPFIYHYPVPHYRAIHHGLCSTREPPNNPYEPLRLQPSENLDGQVKMS